MEIRAVRESELAELVELMCLVYRPNGHARFWRYFREDPSYRLDQSRVVIVDGRIVASLRLWDRMMRVGSCPVRMGGIGAVCTHPDWRGAGYATALMQELISYMRSADYDLGVLFSIIPGAFYRRLGWEPSPLTGFRIVRGRGIHITPKDWQVEPFDEKRDLAQVMELYAACNAQQSGSIVRTPAYWGSGPARVRGVMPTLVARYDDKLGGYLNFEFEEQQASVGEVAYAAQDPTVLAALTHQFLQQCEEQQVTEIVGDFPHRHPLVSLLVDGCAGDLHITGDTSMMLYPIHLAGLLQRILPDLQTRLGMAHPPFAPYTLNLVIQGQQCSLRLDAAGLLTIEEGDLQTERLHLPGDCFARMLLGESSWQQLEPTLRARGVETKPEIARLLATLFPEQSVIFWGPDHF